MSCSTTGTSQYTSCLAEQSELPVADARDVFHAEKARVQRELGPEADRILSVDETIHRLMRAARVAAVNEDSPRTRQMTLGVKQRIGAVLNNTYGPIVQYHPKWDQLNDVNDSDPAGTVWEIAHSAMASQPDRQTSREGAVTEAEMAAMERLPAALAASKAQGRCPGCGRYTPADGSHYCPDGGGQPPTPDTPPIEAAAPGPNERSANAYWDDRAVETYGVPLRNVADDDYFTPNAEQAENTRILIINADDGGMRPLAETEELPQTSELGTTIRSLATTTSGAPSTKEDSISAYLTLRTAADTMREHVDLIEDDLVIRARAHNISDIHDRVTGVVTNRGSGYNYSGWKTDDLTSVIAQRADFGDEITPDDAERVITAYRKYATPDRYRTSALREIGVDARQYSNAQRKRPTLTPRYANEDEPFVGEGTTANILASADSLNQQVAELPDAREQIRTMPFDVAVREYTALRSQQRLLNKTAEHLESLVINRMDGQNATVNGYTVTTVTGRPNAKWDVPAVTQRLTPTVASTAQVDDEKTGRIISTWLNFASVRPKKRDISATGIDVDEYITTSTPRTRLKFETPE